MPARYLVIGASGGIGSAIAAELIARHGEDQVLTWSRRSKPSLNILNEGSIRDFVRGADLSALEVVIDATGFLHGYGMNPEKSWRELDGFHLTQSFAANAIGPALLMKHLLPKLPRKSRGVFATLSARVGSIEDNRLGGWHSYRASKAALNQLVRCNAIELARRAPEAICVSIHPGTVDTQLSEPFAKSGLEVQPPDVAAQRILDTIAGLSAEQSGGFFDYAGEAIPF